MTYNVSSVYDVESANTNLTTKNTKINFNCRRAEIMKYQKCPVCEGLGKVPGYWDMTYGYISIPTDCQKCKGELVIEEPNEEPSQEAVISFYRRLAIGFAVGFFGLISVMLILEYLGLMCVGGN